MKVCSVCGQIDFTGTLSWCPLCDYAMIPLEPISELTVSLGDKGCSISDLRNTLNFGLDKVIHDSEFGLRYSDAIRADKYLEIHADFFRPDDLGKEVI